MSGCILGELAKSLLKGLLVVLYFVPSLLLLEVMGVHHRFLIAEPTQVLRS